jgi:DNA-directed RNA polymerase subunit N (RpoN/RPB10)
MNYYPVRCFSCGKPLTRTGVYDKEVEKGVTPGDALDKLGYTRICCRRMFLGHVEILDKQLKYYLPGEKKD